MAKTLISLMVIIIILTMSGCMVDSNTTPSDKVIDGIIDDSKQDTDPEPVPGQEPNDSGATEDITESSDGDEKPDPTQEYKSTSNEIFKGNDFEKAAKLLSTQTDTDTNYMISTLSINMALSMAANTLNDESRHDLEEFMGNSTDELNNDALQIISNSNYSTDESDKDSALKIANSLWVKTDYVKSLNKDTVSNLKTYYDAEVTGIEREDIGKINSWVYDKTNGMIPSIVDELPDKFASMIINALYFEDTWADEFEESATKEEDFKKPDGTTIKVDMMHGCGDSYMRNSDYEAFRKYYSNGYSFIGIVPTDGKQMIISNINIDTLLESETTNYMVSLAMPKFTFNYSIMLKEALKTVGLEKMFSGGVVTNLVDNQELSISEIIHKTAIEMQESGTKAAAVTGIMYDSAVAIAEPKEVKSIVLDKPFVFVIMDTNDNIVFIGEVNNPEY